MIKVALCSVKKVCSHCYGKLELHRKEIDWISESTQRIVKRRTNVYYCKKCWIDHVMDGEDRDDSGWEPFRVKLTVEPMKEDQTSSIKKVDKIKEEKSRLGIKKAKNPDYKSCNVCLYSGNVCIIHHVETDYDEICKNYCKPKIYFGGSFSPR